MIQTLPVSVLYSYTNKCQQCILHPPFAFAINVFPLNVLKTRSCASVVRAENGPESCLKWGTAVYKKHAHLLKYFIGKRLIVPLRCIRFLQFIFHSLNV